MKGNKVVQQFYAMVNLGMLAHTCHTDERLRNEAEWLETYGKIPFSMSGYASGKLHDAYWSKSDLDVKLEAVDRWGLRRGGGV